MNLNSLDSHLDLFGDISWSIPSGGSLSSDLGYFDDQTDEIIPLAQDPARIQRLSVPLTTGPTRLYFFDKDGEEVGFEYPAGLTGLQVLGAINTFYSKPIDQGLLAELTRNQETYAHDYGGGRVYYPAFIEEIKAGRVPAERDFMADHQFFEGLRHYKDGYTVAIGS